MTYENSRFVPISRMRHAAIAMAIGSAAFGVSAQESGPDNSGEYVDKLKACQLLSNDGERLQCFDRAVGEIVSANEAGDVRIVDREDIRQTQRELFGFSAPNVEILKTDNEEEDKKAREQLETSITQVRYLSRKKFRITTTEGAVWEVNNAPMRLQPVEQGDRVVFKKASLGYFFIRINGQRGVKGRRIE